MTDFRIGFVDYFCAHSPTFNEWYELLTISFEIGTSVA